MNATFHSIWTVILVIIFIGIVAWAWSSRRKADFDEASRLVFDEDEPAHKSNSDSKNQADETK